MTAQYEDWADWAGDHPAEAEADLRRDREHAARRKLYVEASPRGPVFLKPAERAELEAAEQAYRESDEGRATCIVVQLPATSTGPKCDTLGHEYNFGICLDCDQPQPDYEPTDAQIPGTYEIGQAA
jgi:hypothetical protein